MLYTIMKHLRNFFIVKTLNGKFNIENGSVTLDEIQDGQYFLIQGSVFNDGVYKYPATSLKDESFDGSIALLAPPVEFLDLVDEIQSYLEKTERNGYQSESFGGYSYSKATTQNGTMADWSDVFRQRLNVWRKL